MNMDVEKIAKLCHETNRHYCQSIGDDSQLPWEDAPDWQKQSAVKGVNFHLDRLHKGELLSPAASHESWLAEKTATGWKFGTVKDAEKKEHPCFVSFAMLPIEQKMKDYLFSSVVSAFWKCANGIL